MNPLKNGGIYQAVTYTAIFVENANVTITYTTDGNGSVSLDSESVAPATGTAQGSTATAKAGYTFSHWTTSLAVDATSLGAAYVAPQKNDGLYQAVTYTAIFTENANVTINYTTDGNGTVSLDSESVAPATGTAAGSMATAKAGYTFSHWTTTLTVDATGRTAATITPQKNGGIYQAVTYTAIFTENNNVVITYTTDGNGTVSRANESVAPATGTALGSTAVAKPGYTFSHWTTTLAADATTLGAAYVAPQKNGGIYEAVTYTAIFTENANVTITYTTDGNGTVSLDSESVAPATGTALGSIASANPGYTFSHWTTTLTVDATDLSDATVAPEKNGGIYETVTYTAIFTENDNITITYIANEGGYVSRDSESLPPATGVAAGSEASVAVGYHFVNWTNEAGEEVSENEMFVPAKVGGLNVEATYYANFEKNDHAITYAYTGTIPPGAPALPATESEVIFDTLKTVADAPVLMGYTFSDWVTEDADVVDGEFYMPDNDVEFTGFWAINSYDYTVEYYKNEIDVEANRIEAAPGTNTGGIAVFGTFFSDLISDFDLIGNRPSGFKPGSVVNGDQTITISGNVIKVLYEDSSGSLTVHKALLDKEGDLIDESHNLYEQYRNEFIIRVTDNTGEDTVVSTQPIRNGESVKFEISNMDKAAEDVEIEEILVEESGFELVEILDVYWTEDEGVTTVVNRVSGAPEIEDGTIKVVKYIVYRGRLISNEEVNKDFEMTIATDEVEAAAGTVIVDVASIFFGLEMFYGETNDGIGEALNLIAVLDSDELDEEIIAVIENEDEIRFEGLALNTIYSLDILLAVGEGEPVSIQFIEEILFDEYLTYTLSFEAPQFDYQPRSMQTFSEELVDGEGLTAGTPGAGEPEGEEPGDEEPGDEEPSEDENNEEPTAEEPAAEDPAGEEPGDESPAAPEVLSMKVVREILSNLYFDFEALISYFSEGWNGSYSDEYEAPEAIAIENDRIWVTANLVGGNSFEGLAEAEYTVTESILPEDFRFYGIKLSETPDELMQRDNNGLNAQPGDVVIVFNRFAPDTVEITITKQVQLANGTWASTANFVGSLNRTVNYRIIVSGTPSVEGLVWSISGNINDDKVELPENGYFSISNENSSYTISYSMPLSGRGPHDNVASLVRGSLVKEGDDFWVPEVSSSTATVTMRPGDVVIEGDGDGDTTPTYDPDPTPIVDIPDAPPALAQLPPAVEPEEEFTIEDEETPLGNLPKTGTSGVSGIGMMGMGLSGLIGLMGTRKKGKHEDE